MNTALKPLIPLHEQPGMPDMIANVIADTRGHVCAVCELGFMGHAPESQWLGFERHPFQSIPATRAMLDRANELTTEAYRARRGVA